MSKYQKVWYILDEENGSSFNDENERCEVFKKYATAISRAYELAKESPGKKFTIAVAQSVVICPVNNPVIIGTK